MLPTLSEFDIYTPVYLREIRSRTRWNPEGCNTLEERAKVVAETLFCELNHLYSIWLISTEQELYSVIAARTDNRNPREQNIDFIWITEQELQDVGIAVENKPEGNCLHVKNLHFNVFIEPSVATGLCAHLIGKGREAKRFSKKLHVIPVLEHQKNIGCKASGSDMTHCECEDWS